jgi:hypothetical protein
MSAAILSAAVRLHRLAKHLSHHQEAAGQVVGDDRLEPFLRDGFHWRRKLAAGIVDEAMNASVSGYDS